MVSGVMIGAFSMSDAHGIALRRGAPRARISRNGGNSLTSGTDDTSEFRPDRASPSLAMFMVARFEACRAAFSRTLDAESERLAPWLVVALGGGISLYFALAFEPPWWVGALGATLMLMLLVVLPSPWRVARLLAGAMLAITVGFSLATLRTATLHTTMLTRAIGPVRIEGTLLDLDGTPKGGSRLILDVRSISALSPSNTPGKLSINVATPLPEGLAVPGDVVVVNGAFLNPPPPPAAPGAYDFARRSYFDGLGAVGFMRQANVVRVATATDLGNRINMAVWHFRHRVAKRIVAVVHDPAAAGVGVALVTGLRSAIPKEADDALRGAGLTHTLSISGLHLSLIALGIFAAVRFGLALIEPVALRINTKKWAAGAGLFGVSIYFVLTGMSIPAQRSFVMLTLVLVAVMADRRAFTLRNVAIAAGLILLLFPEGVLDAGFQMSFAAVVALVSAHEAFERKRLGVPRDLSWRGRVVRYLQVTTVSSLAATAATAPFGLYHFQVAQNYGVLGNLVALPILGTVVMPAVAASYFLMPFGLDVWAYQVMGWGLEIMLIAARAVTALPGSVHVLHAAPTLAFVSVVLGGLWLTLWGTRWRRWGLVPIALGCIAWATADRPDLLVTGDGRHLAARARNGALVTVIGSTRSFQSALWLRRDGVDPEADETEEDRAARADLDCDDVGCVLPLRGGLQLAVSKSPASLADDCVAEAIVVALEPTRGRCKGPGLVIDRFDLWRNGAYAVWIDDKAIRVETVRDQRGVRPWAPDLASKPPRRPEVSTAASNQPGGPEP